MSKPEMFKMPGDKNKGYVSFVMDACEIEGKRTIHFDAFHENGSLPWGHIPLGWAKNMRAYLDETIKWLEEKPKPDKGE